MVERVTGLLLPVPRDRLVERFARCTGGLALFGLGAALFIGSDLGAAPWDVFHQGIANTFDVSFGLVVVLVGLLVLLTWIPLHQHLGLGTILNTLSIGLIANLGLALIPEQHLLAVRIPFLVIALLGFGLGGGLYIGSGLGPGPRDGLMTAITARGHRLWVVRTIIECSVLVVGIALGGDIGIGTVLIAFLIGPLTHTALRRFHLPVHDDAPEVLGE